MSNEKTITRAELATVIREQVPGNASTFSADFLPRRISEARRALNLSGGRLSVDGAFRVLDQIQDTAVHDGTRKGRNLRNFGVGRDVIGKAKDSLRRQ